MTTGTVSARDGEAADSGDPWGACASESARAPCGSVATAGADEGETLGKLYQDHAPRLRQYLIRCTRDAPAALEILHQAFLVLVRRGLSRVRDPHAFLFRVALNLLRRHQRDRTRETRAVVYDSTLVEALSDRVPADEAGAQYHEAMLRALDDALQTLPTRRQAILALRGQGLTYAEIGTRLGMSREAIGQQVMKGMEQLRKSLLQTQGKESL